MSENKVVNILNSIREKANRIIYKDNKEKDIVEDGKTAVNFITKYAMKLGYEFESYSTSIKVTLFILLFIVLGFVISAVWILGWGLGYTDMSGIFPFGLWIVGDLGFVAIGGGAFTTGFLLYIFRNEKLEPIINSCVLLGFMCYLFTLVLLIFDIGQPIRAWFGYTYPNWGAGLMPQSMLTEVIWCLTFYFIVLIIELIPIPLKHRLLDKHPVIHYIGHYMHRLMWIAAAVGTFLSFFHQGSLGGGMWDVLYAKAPYFREHHLFFFLAIVGATAGGTSFMTLCPWIAQKVMKKELIPKETFHSIAKISGIMFIFYFLFRLFDIYRLSTVTVPAFDRSYIDLWSGYYGIWMLVVEIGFMLLPLILLNIKKFREREGMMALGAAGGVLGIVMHKVNVVLHGASVPNFPWKPFMYYNPTLQEWFLMLGSVAIMIFIYMVFARYLPLFPHAETHENGEAH